MNEDTIKVIERLTKMLGDSLAIIDNNKYTINSQRELIAKYQREIDRLERITKESKEKKND